MTEPARTKNAIDAVRSAEYRARREKNRASKTGLFASREAWNYGPRDRRARTAWIALLELCGEPKKAWDYMEKFEVWQDEKRPPDGYTRWLRDWRAGNASTQVKVRDAIEKQYRAYHNQALLTAASYAAETQVQQMEKVRDGSFDAKLSGVFQHTTQLAVFGFEKHHQANRPVKEAAKFEFSPTFSLVAPPSKPAQLKEAVIEGEVREIGG